jgi:hypothetical protein
MSRLKSGSPFLYDDVTGDIIGLRDADGGDTFFAAPRMTFAQMKALTGMADCQLVFVTNYPANKGSTWRYSAAIGDWFPVSPCRVFERTTTALADGLVQAAAQVIVTAAMEAGLLANKLVRILSTPARNGTTDAMTPLVKLGAAGSTADATIATLTALSGTNRSLGAETWFRMASATSCVRLGGPVSNSFAGSGTSLVANAATVVDTVAEACAITWGCTMAGATDTPQFGYLAVEIQP